MSNKKNINEKIADALDIDFDGEPKEEKHIEKVEPKEISVDPKLKESIDRRSDYRLVRNNLKDIISTGQSAIEGILNVASEGESPRAYEVVSQLIKSVSDANKDLLDLHKKMKDLNKEDFFSNQSADSITNNAIYIGSTKDLQKLISDSKKEAETIDAEYEVIDGESGKPNLPRKS